MKYSRLRYYLFLITETLLVVPNAGFALDIPFTVKNQTEIGKFQEPVTFGIPLSENANIISINDLRIPGYSTQFRVLSRYNGTPSDQSKPIRMVLADFQINMPANGIKKLYLNNGGGTPLGSQKLAEQLTDSGNIVVNTGVLKAVIKPNTSAIFDEVWIDLDGDGYEASEKIIDNPTEDGFVVKHSGTPKIGNKTSLVIEENGPLRTVVKLTGSFDLKPSLGDTNLSYTIRMVAYKRKSYLKLYTTFENENFGGLNESNPAHNIYLNSAYLKTTLNKLGPKTVQFGSYSKNDYMSGDLTLLQRELSDGKSQEYDWDFNITENEVIKKSGEKFDSFIDIRNPKMGMMVASRWFWQNHPKGVSVDGDELNFNFWPDTGTDHRILGGIWKTHELIYYFHGTDTDFSDELSSLRKGLLAKCADSYYAETEFLSAMVPENISTMYEFPAGERLEDAIVAQANNHRASFDSSYATSNDSYDITDLREIRSIPISNDQYGTWYGWLEFGDFVRGNSLGYSALHYDWSYIALMGYLRFGDEKMLEIGNQLVSHQTDIIIMHDSNVTDQFEARFHGGHRYETDALYSYHDTYGNGSIAPANGSHSWSRGILLQYLLTGQERYKDCALHIAEHAVCSLFEFFDCGAPCANAGAIRDRARLMHNLVLAYELFGDVKYLDRAYDIFVNGILSVENIQNGTRKGWLFQSTPPFESTIFQTGITIEPAIELHQALMGDQQTARASNVEAWLNRLAIWQRDVIYNNWTDADCGSYRNSKTEYFPFGSRKLWDKDASKWTSGDHENFYLPYYADLFAFQYEMTQNIKWLNLARNCFKDFYFYPSTCDWLSTASSAREIRAFQQTPSPSWAKSGQYLKKGYYYLRTEWKFNPELSQYTYEDWSSDFGITGAVPTEDEDDDGISNLMEFVMVMNPNVSDLDQFPSVAKEINNGKLYLTYEFRRRVDLSNTVSIIPQLSTDLVGWKNIPVDAIEETIVNDDADGDGLVELVRLRYNIIDQSDNFFLRIKVDLHDF